MDKRLAYIKSANLEIQDRGILTFGITVDYEEGFSQVVGGVCLDDYDKDKEDRVGTAYGCEMIRQLLLELKVDDFSEMKGKHIWVYGEGTGLSFTPKGIQALKGDNKDRKGVMFDEILEMFKE